jgi:sugar O-acyltransferase (sialic acid O-acetyltransferase NeuD family)
MSRETQFKETLVNQSEAAHRKKLVILGTGSYAEAVFSLAHETGQFEVEAFCENWNRTKCSRRICGRPVVWIDEAGDFARTHLAIGALGTTHRSGFIRQAYAQGFSFATLVHPAACVSPEANVGEGSIVSPGAVVAAYSTIGRHVVINRGCLIGHHGAISDFCTISPGANIGGSVTIGEGTYVGMGAIIMDHVAAGSRCVIGAGALVTRSLPDRVQAVGIPAKITKENIDGL